VEAVIDKDLTAAKLAIDIGADILLILTDVEKVALYFGTLKQKWIDKMTIEEAEKYIEEDHFAPGSMLPKVLAAIEFIKNGGEKAIIAKLGKTMEALSGKTGTCILRA